MISPVWLQPAIVAATLADSCNTPATIGFFFVEAILYCAIMIGGAISRG